MFRTWCNWIGIVKWVDGVSDNSNYKNAYINEHVCMNYRALWTVCFCIFVHNRNCCHCTVTESIEWCLWKGFSSSLEKHQKKVVCVHSIHIQCTEYICMPQLYQKRADGLCVCKASLHMLMLINWQRQRWHVKSGGAQHLWSGGLFMNTSGIGYQVLCLWLILCTLQCKCFINGLFTNRLLLWNIKSSGQCIFGGR